MARPTPRAIALVTLAAFALLALLGPALLASAQGGDAGNDSAGNDSAGPGGAAPPGGVPEYDYLFTIYQGSEDPFAWDVTSLSFPAGAKLVAIYNSAGATGDHNVVFTVGSETVRTGLPIPGDSGRQASPIFTMPESGTVPYVCQVHPEMTGTLTVGEFPGATGGAEHITHVGVNYLAHWVGVIAFAALFIFYGLAFFLFKYNETGFATDHKDRAAPAGAGRTESYGEPFYTKRETVVVLALLLAAIGIALAYAFATGLIGR